MTRWGLGVDLGTSFSAGAVAANGRVELLVVGGDRRVPSTVLLTEDGRLLAGSYAERMVGRLPDRAERNPKRYVGRAPMLLGGRPVSAVDALAAVLALFVQEGRRRHDGEPARIVLTHPAAWTAAQQAELREVAARVLPGVEVELMAEPVAAALHYTGSHNAREHRTDGPVAVYDLGGTAVDTAVLAADRGGFRVVGAPGGDPDIGGEGFDQLVYRHFGEQLAHSAPQWWAELATNPERSWLAAAADLLTEARLAKEALSEVETASQYVLGADADVHISRAELDTLIGDDVRRSARVLAGTLAGTEPRAVFLTGGSSRTPLVERVLRDAHGDLVRTLPDPKSAVALGAAGRSLGRAEPQVTVAPAAPTTPDRARRSDPAVPRIPPTRAAPARGGLTTLADSVLDARVAAGRLYTWSAPDGPTGAHRIARIDPRTGHPDHKIRFGRLVGWAVSDAGVIVAERRDGELRCHTLGRDLSVGTSSALPTPYRPFLLADGPVAWALLRSPDTHLVDGPPAGGRGTPPATGETGSLAVQVFPLGTGPGSAAGPVVPLGPAAFWYADGARRFLDAAGPSSAAPALFGDGRSCAVITGHTARQALTLVGPAGEIVQVAEQRATQGGTPWAQQLLGASGRWLLATSVGLESYADLRSGTDRRLFLPRPPGGAVRWVAAGPHAYGLAVDRIVPGLGFGLHALVDGRRRELGRWPSLLGSPAAARPDDAPRVRADGPDLLVGVGDGSGGSQLLRADVSAARVLASAPGWLEPVGRVGDTVLARHVPGAAPGDGCAEAGTLIRLP